MARAAPGVLGVEFLVEPVAETERRPTAAPWWRRPAGAGNQPGSRCARAQRGTRAVPGDSGSPDSGPGKQADLDSGIQDVLPFLPSNAAEALGNAIRNGEEGQNSGVGGALEEAYRSQSLQVSDPAARRSNRGCQVEMRSGPGGCGRPSRAMACCRAGRQAVFPRLWWPGAEGRAACSADGLPAIPSVPRCPAGTSWRRLGVSGRAVLWRTQPPPGTASQAPRSGTDRPGPRCWPC